MTTQNIASPELVRKFIRAGLLSPIPQRTLTRDEIIALKSGISSKEYMHQKYKRRLERHPEYWKIDYQRRLDKVAAAKKP